MVGVLTRAISAIGTAARPAVARLLDLDLDRQLIVDRFELVVVERIAGSESIASGATGAATCSIGCSTIARLDSGIPPS